MDRINKIATVVAVLALAMSTTLVLRTGDPAEADGASTATSSAAPDPTDPTPALVAHLVLADFPAGTGRYETGVARFAQWFDAFGSLHFSPTSMSAGRKEIPHLIDTYGGDDDRAGIVLRVAGRGARVRSLLATAARSLSAGEAALKHKDYKSARAAFDRATVALHDVEVPLRNDLAAVEHLTGLRLTRDGVVSSHTSTEQAVVQRWIDGDTVLTDVGRVRLLGIDAPEMDGSCGPATEAKAAAEQLAPAETRISLINPDSVRDVDRYGRLLRYVEVTSAVSGRTDVGYSLLLSDIAEARYDSRDGFQWHPREAVYRNVRPVTSPATGCTAEAAAFDRVRVLAAKQGEDEQGRRSILVDVVSAPYRSGARNFAKYVESARQRDEKSDREKKAHAAELAASRVTQREPVSNGSSSNNATSRRSSNSGSSSKSTGTAYPDYTGPRCYAPGGQSWKPC